MRVRFLSQYFYPEQASTSDLLSGIAFELAARGASVEGFAGQPAYRNAQRLPRIIRERNVTVRRLRSTQWDKNTSLGRIANTATFTTSALSRSLFSRRADALFTVTTPPLLPWVGQAAQKIRGGHHILIMFDVYPQIAVALGRLRAGSAIERLWRVLNRWAYRGASAIVALGECMAEVLRAELPPDQRGKVVIIPNWSDGDTIRPRPREDHPLPREWGIPADQFVLQYSGNIGLFHEIGTIVNAAERLRGHGVHFVFIGDGGQLPWLKKQVAECRLDNVTLLPFQPKERLPLTLTACNAGLVTLREESTGYCVPCKTYSVLAAGKPVIAVMDERCEIARAVGRHRCGVVVRPGDGEGLAQAIRSLKADAGRARELGRAARQAYEENYTLGIVSGLYANLVQRVCAMPQTPFITERSPECPDQL